MKRIPLIFFLVLGLALSGCSSSGGAAAGAQATAAVAREDDAGAPPLQVVTTIYPPYDFVRAVAGDVEVELTMLLSPGAESHSYDPAPLDYITIENSDLFLYVGGDTDVWVDSVLSAMDRDDMNIIAMMELVDAVEEEIVEGMEHGHDHDDGHEDGDDDHDHDDEDDDHGHDDGERELDEHVWTSPRNAAVIVQAIADALGGLDADNAGQFQQNAAAYIARLDELDGAFGELVAGAARNTVMFGDRFPFRYFADAYGLEYYAAFPGCSTQTDASAGTVAFLIDKVRDENIPVVFYIELSNGKMAQTICEETGTSALMLHSCHNITRDDFLAGVTYVDLMWQNFENLKEALY